MTNNIETARAAAFAQLITSRAQRATPALGQKILLADVCNMTASDRAELVTCNRLGLLKLCRIDLVGAIQGPDARERIVRSDLEHLGASWNALTL